MSEAQQILDWGATRVPVICSACEWRYLAVAEEIPDRCLHCGEATLERLEPRSADFPAAARPEWVVPFSVADGVIDQSIATFVKGIPLPPMDLNLANLRGRFRRLYLPMWLVDSDVAATWQAEVGFDYEVVSHQERYADGAGWRTEEVHETRINWEPRVGCLERHYDNVATPALTAHGDIQAVLGAHDVRAAKPFQPEMVRGALVRAPDRAPEAAWPEAEMGVRQRAIDDCQRAAGADHLRNFRWAPTYANRVWTLLLLPVYATYYLDDEGAAQQVLIHGQTGQITGSRRGSLARAHRLSWTIGIVALILFVLSLALSLAGLLFPPLVIIGVLGALLAIPIGIAAIVPTARVTLFNRREASHRDLQSWEA